MWPRRKKSDLMSHLVPASRPQRRPSAAAEVPKEPTQAPVKIPIQKKSSSQDSMWPRRRKSDLLIYQQTRCLNWGWATKLRDTRNLILFWAILLIIYIYISIKYCIPNQHIYTLHIRLYQLLNFKNLPESRKFFNLKVLYIYLGCLIITEDIE